MLGFFSLNSALEFTTNLVWCTFHLWYALIFKPFLVTSRIWEIHMLVVNVQSLTIDRFWLCVNCLRHTVWITLMHRRCFRLMSFPRPKSIMQSSNLWEEWEPIQSLRVFKHSGNMSHRSSKQEMATHRTQKISSWQMELRMLFKLSSLR